MNKILRYSFVALLAFFAGVNVWADDEYVLYSGDITEGDYIIYYSGKAMKNTVTSGRLDYDEVTPKDDKIVNPDASIVWTIAESSDYYTLYNSAVKMYAASTGAKNKAQLLEDGTDDKSLWTISGTDTYEFVNKANASNKVNSNLRNNGTYGFACYSTSTGGALTLYKKTASVPAAVATPEISGETSFKGSTSVTISCDTEGATIYYTTDGTDPTSESIEYTDAFTITKTTTVKAIAILGEEASSVATQEFVALPAVDDPVISGETPFVGSTEVTITCGTDGTTIYYTTDGTEPTAESTAYTAAFTITESTTVKAIAISGEDESNVVSKEFTGVSINTMAEAQAAEKGTTVIVEGTVVAAAATGAVLYDGTDYLYYYNTKNALTVGQKVRMQGALSSYGGANQLPAAATITELGTEEVTHPAATTLTGADFEAIKTAEVAERKYVTFEGKLAINKNYYNLTIDGAETAVGSIVKPNEDLSELNGKKVVVTGYLMYVNNQYVYVVATSVTEYKYAININASANGSVAIEGDLTEAEEGTEITIVATPADKYELSSITVVDAEGNIITVEGNNFTMPASAVSISAVFSNSTGIAELRTAEQNAHVFNLAGQRVAAGQKGLLIKNGRKLIVK